MFRDRPVSMEQTLEGGEKYLSVLKEICHEALPDLTFREHSLDHERDLFVMDFEAPDGSRRRIGWTRMVLYDAERLPALTADPASLLRAKIVQHLRRLAGRPEIVVTFRHLEDGWVDTPEPRREGRRRRRGERGGGRGPERRPGGPPQRERRPGERGGGGGPAPKGPTPKAPPSPRPAAAPARGQASAPGETAGQAAEGRRRRRFRRRRRGRGSGGGAAGPPPSSPAGSKP